MTIRTPKLSLADKFLKMLGKKRGLILPSDQHKKKFGPYATITMGKENFFRALLRPGNEPLPDGMIDIFSIISTQKTKS